MPYRAGLLWGGEVLWGGGGQELCTVGPVVSMCKSKLKKIYAILTQEAPHYKPLMPTFGYKTEYRPIPYSSFLFS